MNPTLYDLALSGNCHKVKLLASLLGLPLTVVPVDFLAGEHRRPPLSDLNPFCEIPILVDGDVVLRDSQTILAHLARKAGRDDWYPRDLGGEISVLEWLLIAENEIARGPNDARLHDKFGYDIEVEKARDKAARILSLMDQRLASSPFLAGDRPTIADVACLPYVAVAHEGGVSLAPHAAVRAWMARMEALPGYLPMPGQETRERAA